MVAGQNIPSFRASLDLAEVVEPLARAERALGAFSQALKTTPFARSWRLRHFREAAVAEAHLAGFSANADKVQIARLELAQGALPTGGRWACTVLEALEKALRVRPAALLKPPALAGLGFPRPGMFTLDRYSTRLHRFEDDAEDMMARLETWYEHFGRAPRSLLEALEAVLGWHAIEPFGTRQEPAARLVLAALMARGRLVPDLSLHIAPYEMKMALPSPAKPQAFVLSGLELIDRAARAEKLTLDGLQVRYREARRVIEARKTSRSRLLEVFTMLMVEECASADILARRMKRMERAISSRALRDILSELEKMGLVHEVTNRPSFRFWRPAFFRSPAHEIAALPRPEFASFETLMKETEGLASVSEETEGVLDTGSSPYEDEEDDEGDERF